MVTQTAGVDNHFRVKLMRWTTGSGSAGTAFTPVKRNATSVAAGSTVKIKATTTAFALGTTTTIVDQFAPNGRALFEWIARDDDDMIATAPGEYLCSSYRFLSSIAVIHCLCRFSGMNGAIIFCSFYCWE